MYKIRLAENSYNESAFEFKKYNKFELNENISY